jgi:hypothetical protein
VPQVRLSVAGAIVLPLLAGVVLGWLDDVIRPGPGWVTLLGAVTMSVFVAARVIPAGLFWAVTMPPITVLVAVGVGVLLDGPTTLVAALGDAAPAVLLATTLGSGLALVRMRQARQSVRHAGRDAAPAAARTAVSPRPT